MDFYFLGLCRVDLLLEQILRIDPKSSIPLKSTILPTHPSETNTSISDNRNTTFSSIKQQTLIPNRKFDVRTPLRMPIPTISEQNSSSRILTLTADEKTAFKPIPQQLSPYSFDHSLRLTPHNVHNNNYYIEAKVLCCMILFIFGCLGLILYL